MFELDILVDVLYDLDHQDYEEALRDISELEGGVYDQIKTLIAAQEYDEARRLTDQEIDKIQDAIYADIEDDD